MDFKSMSKEEYFNLPEKEKEEIKRQIDNERHKLFKFELAYSKMKEKEAEKETAYIIYEYENFSKQNLKNAIDLWGVPQEKGYIVFLSDEKLNPVEQYGLERLMVNVTEKHFESHNKGIDMLVTTYIGKYKANQDCIYSDEFSYIEDNFGNKIKLSIKDISSISDRASFLKKSKFLDEDKFAYCLFFYKIKRKNNSLIYNILTKPQFKELKSENY